jgi:hypothetical protein
MQPRSERKNGAVIEPNTAAENEARSEVVIYRGNNRNIQRTDATDGGQSVSHEVKVLPNMRSSGPNNRRIVTEP